jgi:hypothetical protein
MSCGSAAILVLAAARDVSAGEIAAMPWPGAEFFWGVVSSGYLVASVFLSAPWLHYDGNWPWLAISSEVPSILN